MRGVLVAWDSPCYMMIFSLCPLLRTVCTLKLSRIPQQNNPLYIKTRQKCSQGAWYHKTKQVKHTKFSCRG